MAALNPAACASLTFSSKLHTPRTISTNVLFFIGSTLLVSGEHASKGSAKFNDPHIPDAGIDGAVITRDLLH